MRRDCGPEIRNMPTPPAAAPLAMATMVSRVFGGLMAICTGEGCGTGGKGGGGNSSGRYEKPALRRAFEGYLASIVLAGVSWPCFWIIHHCWARLKPALTTQYSTRPDGMKAVIT